MFLIVEIVIVCAVGQAELWICVMLSVGGLWRVAALAG